MKKQLQIPLGPNEWRISHAHGYSLLPVEDVSKLTEWRMTVENQGCKFVISTLVRDPLSHAISQLKSRIHLEMIRKVKISPNEWVAHLGTSNRTASTPWWTQLDYFLFNRWDKNLDLNITMTKEEKVVKALDMMRNHFDFVMYEKHNLFVDVIARIMGFEPILMAIHNVFPSEISLSYQELDLIKSKVYENGDVDWVNAIRHIYEDQLWHLQ
jgi:hypothetical protein